MTQKKDLSHEFDKVRIGLVVMVILLIIDIALVESERFATVASVAMLTLMAVCIGLCVLIGLCKLINFVWCDYKAMKAQQDEFDRTGE